MKAICLLSGGIDSAVAAYLMLKQNMDMDFIHFDNRPLTDESSLNKCKLIVRVLSERFNKKFRLHSVEHGKNHIEIMRNCNNRYHCVLCRRVMYRVAEITAKKLGCAYLVTGESLAQVASQTLENIAVESRAIEMQVLRPLLCYDKQEIIKLGKEIGTFDISTMPGMCCNAVPRRPVTKARLDLVEVEEKGLNMQELVAKTYEGLHREDWENCGG